MTLDVLDETTLARLGRVEVWVSLYWDEPRCDLHPKT